VPPFVPAGGDSGGCQARARFAGRASRLLAGFRRVTQCPTITDRPAPTALDAVLAEYLLVKDRGEIVDPESSSLLIPRRGGGVLEVCCQ